MLSQHLTPSSSRLSAIVLKCYCAQKSCYGCQLFSACSFRWCIFAVGLVECCHHLIPLPHLSSVCLRLQTALADMYANFWSLLSLLCRQLLTFQLCSSLRWTFQAPFLFLFQMFSTKALRVQDGDMKYLLAPASQSGAVALSSSVHAVLYKECPAGTKVLQAGMLLIHMFSLPVCALLVLRCVHVTALFDVSVSCELSALYRLS